MLNSGRTSVTSAVAIALAFLNSTQSTLSSSSPSQKNPPTHNNHSRLIILSSLLTLSFSAHFRDHRIAYTPFQTLFNHLVQTFAGQDSFLGNIVLLEKRRAQAFSIVRHTSSYKEALHCSRQDIYIYFFLSHLVTSATGGWLRGCEQFRCGVAARAGGSHGLRSVPCHLC